MGNITEPYAKFDVSYKTIYFQNIGCRKLYGCIQIGIGRWLSTSHATLQGLGGLLAAFIKSKAAKTRILINV